jgi:hypothetical protein
MRTLLLAPLIVTLGAASSSGTMRQHPTGDQCSVVHDAYEQASKLKPGMTRADIERAWTHDGGLDAIGHSRYIFSRCEYIQIGVEFRSVGDRQSSADVIKSVSGPYIAPPALD